MKIQQLPVFEVTGMATLPALNCELIGQKCCLEWTCNERENYFGDLSSVTWLLEMITEKDVNNGSANIDLQERYQI